MWVLGGGIRCGRTRERLKAINGKREGVERAGTTSVEEIILIFYTVQQEIYCLVDVVAVLVCRPRSARQNKTRAIRRQPEDFTKWRGEGRGALGRWRVTEGCPVLI